MCVYSNLLQFLLMTITENVRRIPPCLYSFRNKSFPDIKKHIPEIRRGIQKDCIPIVLSSSTLCIIPLSIFPWLYLWQPFEESSD